MSTYLALLTPDQVVHKRAYELNTTSEIGMPTYRHLLSLTAKHTAQPNRGKKKLVPNVPSKQTSVPASKQAQASVPAPLPVFNQQGRHLNECLSVQLRPRMPVNVRFARPTQTDMYSPFGNHTNV